MSDKIFHTQYSTNNWCNQCHCKGVYLVHEGYLSCGIDSQLYLCAKCLELKWKKNCMERVSKENQIKEENSNQVKKENANQIKDETFSQIEDKNSLRTFNFL